ncbi:DUF2631 domain-containing protein [Nakamurella aerolata]|uniref:DUF2631 domain-containing protein n=1 Tax=Nakamurella aerolata TaxID=1656892 RepID=UPI0031B5FD71
MAKVTSGPYSTQSDPAEAGSVAAVVQSSDERLATPSRYNQERVDDAAHLPAEAEHGSGHVLRYNPDAPSEAWGWHGEWKLFASKGSRLLLLVFTAVIFLMLFGNHVSRVEDWWLAVIGVGMLIWIASREVAARKERRRRP